MNALLSLLSARVLAPFVGLIALSSAIWLMGPQIAFGTSRPLESQAARLITILVIVLIWVVNRLLKIVKANKANKGMVEGLVEAKTPDPDRSQEEVATLKERFEKAVDILKKSKGKKSRLSLYDLPWYIIIGPPGSGKTTALVNSGLDFPLADQFGREALGGVGGTRNCDWWFTDEAILLDTAGRYTTQDSDAKVDKSAWEGFLGLLKKYRKRRPINGVIVAISLLDLMTLNEHERLAHARAIKTRIQELDKFFKIRFPVYVMLTKCDLVAGFMEFFDDLSRADREQVWGATFPIDESDSDVGAVDRFVPELDALLERLNSRLLTRMSQERDPRRRAAIYGFPRQLATLRDNVGSFLNDIFRGSRFDQAPMLRGVYFTSGTQEGTPIDRLMGMVARTFGLEQQVLPAQGGRGRSYFLKGLLKDVVFPEREVAGTNRRFEMQRAWLQRAAYAGSVLLALLLAAGWTVSYLNNRALVERARVATTAAGEALAAVRRDDSDVLSLVPALEAVRAIPSIYDSEDAPWLQGLGLYQGRKLAARSRVAYQRALKELLLPRLIVRTEGHLRAGGAQPDFLYEALKAYLMLDSREHYERATVGAWFEYDFLRYLQPRAVQADRDAYMRHIDALFEQQPVPLPVTLDAALIDESQRVVARMPTEQRAYSRLKQSDAARSLKSFTLFDAAGPRSQLVFSRRSGAGAGEGIPGLFTREGYQRFFVTQSVAEAGVLIDESWILGPYAPANLDTVSVLARVKNLYLEEFADNYEDFLADIQLAPFSTPEEASNILSILSDPASSPLVLVLRAVAEQTQLEPPVAAADGASRDAGALSRLGGLLGGDRPAQAAAPGTAANVVDERFKALREYVGAGGDPSKAPVQGVVALFDQLYRFMAVVVSQRGAESPRVREEGQLAVQQARNGAQRNTEVKLVQDLLQDAATRSQNIVFRGVQANINAQWQSDGLPLCRAAIQGRYPIDRNSASEIQLDDFSRFFGRQGVARTFFDSFLNDYVDKSRRPWRPKTTAAAPVQISAEALRQFERAEAITNTFFNGATPTPSVSFDLTPLEMTSTITRFTLDVAGQQVSYDHGPVRRQALRWPGPQESGEVRIEMQPAAAGQSMFRDEGPWAWFRLLDRSSMKPGDKPETFTVEFKLGERSALLELTARSAYNPFRFEELEQFRCPESL